MALDADVQVVEEAEHPDAYRDLLPDDCSLLWQGTDAGAKGVLVVARSGWSLKPVAVDADTAFQHVLPLDVTAPDGQVFGLWAVWTLHATPREAAYVGQLHRALDAWEGSLTERSIVIGDFNSGVAWDHERRRNHTALVDRLGQRGLFSAYHQHFGEAQGSETRPTFFLQRNAGNRSTSTSASRGFRLPTWRWGPTRTGRASQLLGGLGPCPARH